MSVPEIPISQVRIGDGAERLVLEVLRSGHLVQGPMVARLEEAFKEACGTRHAVAVNSGTTAIVAALTALDLGPGDEVITSPFTFAATLNAILEVGATARFVDIDARDYTIDPTALEAAVSERTKAIIPVHLYGQPAAMDDILRIGAKHRVHIVEDAAQALGARVGDRAVGSFGVGCFSLYATKNVTTGEGGVVTTDDDEVADRIRLLRNQGMRARYEYVTPGHNWRLTDLQAAIGIPQMEALASISDARRRNADLLDAGLCDIPGIQVPWRAPGRTHVFHQYTILVHPQTGLSRDELAARLSDEGIATGIYYPRLVHDYECYRDRADVEVDVTPHATRAASQVLSLPVHPGIDADHIERVTQVVRQIVRQ